MYSELGSELPLWEARYRLLSKPRKRPPQTRAEAAKALADAAACFPGMTVTTNH
jgi:hypothetical protein